MIYDCKNTQNHQSTAPQNKKYVLNEALSWSFMAFT